jgi:hypothetical protein
MSTSDAKLQKLNQLVGIHAMDIILALFLLVALILSAIAYGSLRTLGNTDYKYDDKNNKAPTSYNNSKRSSLGLLIMVLLAMIFLAIDLFKKHQGAQKLAEVLIKERINYRY